MLRDDPDEDEAPDSAAMPAQGSADPPARGGRLARIRLRLLVTVMAALAALLIVHTGRVWYYEHGLRVCAMSIIEKVNAEDPIPVSEEGPEADVDIEVTCGFEHVVFGEKTGKVRLVVRPRPHAPIQETYAICHIFEYVDGHWEETESYHEH